MAVMDFVLKLPVSIWTLVFSLGIIVYLTQAHFRSGLRKIPGPVIAHLTNWWRLYDVSKGAHQETLIDLHRTYGSDLIRIGPNVVSIAEPEAVKIVYGLNKGFTKASLLDFHLAYVDLQNYIVQLLSCTAECQPGEATIKHLQHDG